MKKEKKRNHVIIYIKVLFFKLKSVANAVYLLQVKILIQLGMYSQRIRSSM